MHKKKKLSFKRIPNKGCFHIRSNDETYAC